MKIKVEIIYQAMEDWIVKPVNAVNPFLSFLIRCDRKDLRHAQRLDIDVELEDEKEEKFLVSHKHPYTDKRTIFEIYKNPPKIKKANVDGPIKGESLSVNAIDDRLRSTTASSEKWNDKLVLKTLEGAIKKLKSDRVYELKNQHIESYMKKVALRNGYPPIHPNNRCRIKRISKEKIIELNKKIQSSHLIY